MLSLENGRKSLKLNYTLFNFFVQFNTNMLFVYIEVKFAYKTNKQGCQQ